MAERRGGGRLVAVAVLALSLGGCVRGCPSSRPPIHPNPNMDQQEKYQPQEASRFFYDGSAMRLPVPGTIPRGGLIEDEPYHTGKDAAGAFLATIPAALDEALVARGAERYDIYCSPCHDRKGNGKGILYERGKVPTASFHDEKYLAYPDGQLYDVITNGLGLMPGYRYPIPVDDRWAIVAHVRRLQREKLARDQALGVQR